MEEVDKECLMITMDVRRRGAPKVRILGLPIF